MRFETRHEQCDSCECVSDTIHLCQVCTETLTSKAIAKMDRASKTKMKDSAEKRWNFVKDKFPGVAETIEDLIEKEESNRKNEHKYTPTEYEMGG